jgi:hypothetical protein
LVPVIASLACVLLGITALLLAERLLEGYSSAFPPSFNKTTGIAPIARVEVPVIAFLSYLTQKRVIIKFSIRAKFGAYSREVR